MNFKEGDTFDRIGFDSNVRITQIQTRGLDKKKLDREIYHFEYIDAPRPGFTTYLKDIESLISFGRWELVENKS